MATQITATTPRTRPARPVGLLEVALLAALVAAVIGVGVWTQARPDNGVTADRYTYGAGYPLHGGLAGPSRVGGTSTPASPHRPLSTAELGAHYGNGYPLHGGLAGPSRTLVAAGAGAHYGAGYPLHGGLAGPSSVGAGD